ncbi:TonB family protein [bacterium]|nr:TonB family protein [bacterium]
MNKFIISLCFFAVLSLHILLFLYYRNTQIITSKQNQNTIVLLQLSKVTQIQETAQPIVQEKKEIIEKEIVKELPKKQNIIDKPIIKKAIKEDLKKSKEIKKSEDKLVKPTTPTIQKEELKESLNKVVEKIEKSLPQINNQEQEYIDSYASKLRDEINKNKAYPTISKKLKEEGRVILSFRVLKSGQFTNIKILVSSNKERLDKAALNALYDTKEYESFDKSINKEFLDFELPLEFKLN